MLTVNDLMTVNPTTVKVTDSLTTVIGRMKREGCRQMPVTDDKRHLVGIVTDRDVRMAVQMPTITEALAKDQVEILRRLSAESVMTANPITTEPDASAYAVAAALATYKFGAMPVVENGLLIGIISVTDYLSYFAAQSEEVTIDG
jgi:acetoin utilization protein AcuB